VEVHLFDDYWEDLGTIKSYYEANIALTDPNPRFRFNSPEAPIYTEARHLPPSEIVGGTITKSMIVDGSVIGDGAVVVNSIIGLRCRIGKNVTIRNSIIMGSDYYQMSREVAADLIDNRPPIGVGDGSVIERAIIDKGCRIGKNVQIKLCDGMPANADLGDVVIRDGIIVVPAGTVLPDGSLLYTPHANSDRSVSLVSSGGF
jgi:glucose-1-phosphate adenylyltransferase